MPTNFTIPLETAKELKKRIETFWELVRPQHAVFLKVEITKVPRFNHYTITSNMVNGYPPTGPTSKKGDSNNDAVKEQESIG